MFFYRLSERNKTLLSNKCLSFLSETEMNWTQILFNW